MARSAGKAEGGLLLEHVRATCEEVAVALPQHIGVARRHGVGVHRRKRGALGFARARRSEVFGLVLVGEILHSLRPEHVCQGRLHVRVIQAQLPSFFTLSH